MDSSSRRIVYRNLFSVQHRVDRVLGFFASRSNWDLPPPPPAGECAPPWFPGGGWGAHSLAGVGVGESQFGRGDKYYGTLGTYVQYSIVEVIDRKFGKRHAL
jgi:hypothetical protein